MLAATLTLQTKHTRIDFTDQTFYEKDGYRKSKKLEDIKSQNKRKD